MPDNLKNVNLENTTLSQDQSLESSQEPKPTPSKTDAPPVPPLPGEGLVATEEPLAPPRPLGEELPLPPPPARVIATPKKPPSRRKIIAGITILLFFLASISAGVFLVRQRQETRSKAETCPPETCSGSGYLCAGDCACNWQLIRGVRWHYKCVDDKVESYNEFDSSCDSSCQAQTTPGETCASDEQCISWHSETKENATWSCQPGSPDAEGDGCLQICKSGFIWEMPGYAKCVKVEAPAGALTCQRSSNTSITLINQTGQSISYEVVEFRGCSHTSNTCQGDKYKTNYYQSSLPNGQTKTESISAAHCETVQFDVKSLNTSFPCITPEGRPWEGGTAFAIDTHWDESCQPTPTPTTVTPTPTPTAKPTPIPESTSCEKCRVYDSSWNLITDFSKIKVGQKIYLTTYGLTTYPAGETPLPGRITKARFRINEGIWQETEEIRGTWKCVGQTCTSPEFYITYTIPSAGSYTIESMVYNETFGWQ